MEHLGEADVSDRRCHAGQARCQEAVPGDGPGHVGPVADRVDPQVLVVLRRFQPEEVDAADALPVFRDVRVVDVESGVYHADGNRGPAGAGEDARRAGVDAQRVRTHGGHGSIVGGLDNPDGLYGENEVGGRKRVKHIARDIRRINPNVGIVPADHRAQ